MYGNPNKTYWVDDTVNPDDYDEDELAEEKARRGQFSVIFKLFEYLPEAREAKAHLDRIIDLCGERPIGKQGIKGTLLHHRLIIETAHEWYGDAMIPYKCRHWSSKLKRVYSVDADEARL